MDLELPDGTVVQGIPDGLSKAEITNKLVAKGFGGSLSSKADLAMANPASGMSGVDRFLAGAGKSMTDIGRGASQIVSAGNQQEIDESRKRDAPLMNTGAGLAGAITGSVATALPTMFIPGANTYAGAAAGGALMGALAPTSGNESRLTNTVMGGALGAGAQGAGNLIGRGIRPVRPNAAPEYQRLAQVAQDQGIPLTPGQLTGSRPLQITESVMENLPLTSGPQLAQRQAQREAFNRSVGRTFGADDAALTPDVMGAARTRIGGRFTDLAARNTMVADDAFMNRLGQIEINAQRNLTPDVGGVVLNRVDDVLERIENGTMTGTAYRNLDSELGRSARGTANGDLRNALGDLRGVLREAMDRSISPADQAAWQGARRQYANLMTVAPLAARSEVGDVSGRTLLNAANTGNRNARFGAPSELAELGRVGRAFVADQIPNSGTAQRQLIQTLLTAGGGSGVGATAAAATGNDPFKGALLGAGVTGAGILTPRLIQAAMQSGPGNAYLTRGLLDMNPDQQALLNAITRGLLAGPTLINSAQ